MKQRRFNRTPRLALLGIVVLSMVVGASRLVRGTSSEESRSAATLRSIATTFNDDYEANNVGPVYDRWDSASQSIIPRSKYVQRHELCPTTPGHASTRSVTKLKDGYWSVVYVIDGTPLTDYWHYVSGAWRFNLARSNPGAVALYEEPFASYARAVGCSN